MSSMRKTINFVLASNNANSITRIVAEYANALVSRGFEVYVSYPIVSFWDHYAWSAEKEAAKIPGLIAPVYRFLKFWWQIVRSTITTIVKSKGMRWQGSVRHAVDKRIKINRFWRFPSAHSMPDADVMIVMQNYLIPRLLFLPPCKGKIIGSIHMDYQAMIHDNDEASRSWWKQFLSIDQQLKVPRFAVSIAAKTSAEACGISVEEVIYNGINLEEFNDIGRPVLNNKPLRVMMFCALAPPKGQDFGCQVVRELKNMYGPNQVQFVSIGEVKVQWKDLFDENLGYLYGKEYARAYQKADIFIYPALRDGFPAPPLEALACGCALATTAVQGVIEYCIDGKNCFISEPGDIKGMVANVQKLIDNRDLRKQFSQEGLGTVMPYTWEKCTDKLINFLSTFDKSA